ncbi:transcriptional regulator [candidate division GN15 bacterium]|uniref:Transcriptional regulator n=1 Tax=candidate division GN15 bacterium TaxID=2072418 RepID=A0A855X407_9BACT|nr:MAG: transcriptional regulator [candidate division GN15 bacterium]
MYQLKAEHVFKRFGSRKVLNDISFELRTGDSMAVVGPNGSGKSTLLMLLLASGRPTRGTIEYALDSKPLDDSAVRSATSLVSPYLNLYDTLTAEENLIFFAAVSGRSIQGKEINAMLTRVGLEGRGPDQVGAYSSGMKQRLKYAVALLNRPAYLFLDEPTSNLDEDGKRIVADLIEEYRSQSIIVIATNEPEEQRLARTVCRVA